MNKVDKIIANYNNGEIDDVIEGVFNNNVDLFYQYIDKKGRFDDLDYDTEDTEDYNNYFLYFLANKNPEKFLDIATDSFDDVFKTEDGEYYIGTSDYSDIAKLFCENRYSLSPKSVETILDGEDSVQWSDYTTDDLQLLFEAIIREQKIITADTELLEEIAEEQENNGILELNSENLSRIFMDKDSAKSVLNQLEEQGSEIKSNLYFIHESSYNDAYHSEVYDNVMGALEDYFGSKPEYVYPTEKGKKSYVKMKLNKINFFDYLKDYIYENRKYPQTNFDYFGSYLYLISNEDECLKVFAPDYADWSKTKENINSFFPDYF
jgi:hypothetical protein